MGLRQASSRHPRRGSHLLQVAILSLLVMSACASKPERAGADVNHLEVVRDAIDATEAAGTGHFVQIEEISFLGSSMLKTIDGDYDLVAPSSSSVLTLEAEGLFAEMAGDDLAHEGLSGVEFRIIQVDGETFLNVSEWPKELEGRWMHFEAEDAQKIMRQGGLVLEPSEGAPTPLFAVLDSLTGPVERKGPTYTMHASGEDLISVLGASTLKGLLNFGSDLEVEGSFPIDVTLTDGVVQEVRFNATRMFHELLGSARLEAMPPGFEDLEMVVRLTLSQLGDPVVVNAPPKGLWKEV